MQINEQDVSVVFDNRHTQS